MNLDKLVTFAVNAWLIGGVVLAITADDIQRYMVGVWLAGLVILVFVGVKLIPWLENQQKKQR